jgi:hypothetical protein
VFVSFRDEALLPGAPSVLVIEAEMEANGRARLVLGWGSNQDAGMDAPDVNPTIFETLVRLLKMRVKDAER